MDLQAVGDVATGIHGCQAGAGGADADEDSAGGVGGDSREVCGRVGECLLDDLDGDGLVQTVSGRQRDGADGQAAAADRPSRRAPGDLGARTADVEGEHAAGWRLRQRDRGAQIGQTRFLVPGDHRQRQSGPPADAGDERRCVARLPQHHGADGRDFDDPSGGDEAGELLQGVERAAASREIESVRAGIPGAESGDDHALVHGAPTAVGGRTRQEQFHGVAADIDCGMEGKIRGHGVVPGYDEGPTQCRAFVLGSGGRI